MTVIDGLLDLLYPPKCPFCARILEQKGDLLCPDCQRELPWLEGGAAEKRVELTAGCVAPLRYKEKAREGVHAYKFRGMRSRGRAFGVLIAQCVTEHGVEADVVTWVPLSKKRLRERGYDQAELLAKRVGRELGLPVVRTLRKEDRPPQSGLEHEAERRANIAGAYTAVEPDALSGRRVLLVDDVVTTGATLSECAARLLLAGAEEVSCATLARAK